MIGFVLLILGFALGFVSGLFYHRREIAWSWKGFMKGELT